jgi:hypothetical protein
VSAAPELLLPSALYGLRVWDVVGEHGSERLAGPQRHEAWPTARAWMTATCTAGHSPPGAACRCGLHAWHPRLRWARRCLGGRRQIPGVIEARGPVEVHEDGFRAQSARPYVLVRTTWANPALLDRLALAYEVPVVDVRGARDLLAWCRARGLGLDEGVVSALLGPRAGEARRRRARLARASALRLAAVAGVVAVLLALGIAHDPKGTRVLFGRTGPIVVHH